MSEADLSEGFAGSCRRSDCTVGERGGHCALDLQPIECPEFEPDAIDASPLDSEPDSGEAILSQSADALAEQPDPSTGTKPAEVGIAHAVIRDSPVSVPTGPRKRIDLASDLVDISSGYPLSSSEASVILRSESTIVVALVGPPDCGKTTMLAAMYELFCKAPIGRWRFAGSHTLNGIMRRAWYARVVSGASTADTTRTRFNIERPFLHLRIGDASESRTSLLIADLSGEYFREAGSGSGVQDAVELMRRADHVLHLIDSGHFVDPRDRLRAQAAARQRIQRLMEDGTFSRRARHTVVLTRHDLCPDEYRVDLLDFAESVAADLLDGAEVISLVSRPPAGGTQSGFDVMFDSLMKPTERHRSAWDLPRAIRPTTAVLARRPVNYGTTAEVKPT